MKRRNERRCVVEDKSKVEVGEGMVLTVPNHHIEMSGKPPGRVATGCYTAYFENDYGEQLLFQYDYKEKKGTLWHGDYSWEEPLPVMGGGTTLTMSEEEREWLGLVWRVATRHETKEFQLRSALDLVNAHKTIFDNLLARPEFAGDAFMRRTFLRTRNRLEKEAKALTDELGEAQIEEATGVRENLTGGEV
jgi:hypothetical protein